MSDNKIADAGKGLLYIVALGVCTVLCLTYLSNNAVFIHIPVSGIIRKIGLAANDNHRLMLSITAFMYFVCPGWLLSQIIFKGNHEVRNFAVYSLAPLLIIVILSSIGYMVSSDVGFLFSGKDIFKGLIEIMVLFGVPVVVIMLLGMVLLELLGKRAVNIIIGGLFVVTYFFTAIRISVIE